MKTRSTGHANRHVPISSHFFCKQLGWVGALNISTEGPCVCNLGNAYCFARQRLAPTNSMIHRSRILHSVLQSLVTVQIIMVVITGAIWGRRDMYRFLLFASGCVNMKEAYSDSAGVKAAVSQCLSSPSPGILKDSKDSGSFPCVHS